MTDINRAADIEVSRDFARVTVRIWKGPAARSSLRNANRNAGTAPTTIEDLAGRFLQRYARRHTRERTWRETARVLGSSRTRRISKS